MRFWFFILVAIVIAMAVLSVATWWALHFIGFILGVGLVVGLGWFGLQIWRERHLAQ